VRWTPGGISGDIEDRRSQGFPGGRGAGIGAGGFLILVLLSLIFKQDFVSMFYGPATYTNGAPDPARDAAEKPTVEFVSFVLDDTQKTWTRVLPASTGAEYRNAKLVLFRDGTDSGCGFAQAATGPFYCPADEKVYIDLSFFDELKTRFGAPGEFAQAYVLAHEIGHHVQNILGLSTEVRNLQQRNPQAVNALSVRLELQADCFAGIWANSTAQRSLLEDKDVESGLRAAAAVGDDRIQRMGGSRVKPESFTHGSSEQRMDWFNRGLQSGQVGNCDTFAQR
jgi:predicted metalloprotease